MNKSTIKVLIFTGAFTVFGILAAIPSKPFVYQYFNNNIGTPTLGKISYSYKQTSTSGGSSYSGVRQGGSSNYNGSGSYSSSRSYSGGGYSYGK